MKDLILAELIKHGWEVDPRDNPNVVIAHLPVKTFRGMDTAKIRPVIVFEEGDVAVRAEFTCRGDNALACCCAYIKNEDEIPSKILEFHADVVMKLSETFSVRIAA